MRQAPFTWNLSFAFPNDIPRTGLGSCFQVCKASSFFSYDFGNDDIYCFNGKTKEQAIDRTIELTYMLIKELDMNVNFQYLKKANGGNTFSFSINKPGLYDLYACVIMSRYFVSDEEPYHSLICKIDYLVNKGYTVMEAYLISSLFTGSAGFSFTGPGLFSIHKYRALKNKKKTLLDNKRGMNYNFTTLCKSFASLLPVPDEEMESVYFERLNKMDELDRYLIVMDQEMFNEKKSVIGMKVEYIHRLQFSYNANTFCREKSHIQAVSQLHILVKEFIDNPNNKKFNNVMVVDGYSICKEYLECLSLVDVKDVINNNKEYFMGCLTPTGKALSKRIYWLKELHKLRNFDLVEEINNLSFLPNKLTKWKK